MKSEYVYMKFRLLMVWVVLLLLPGRLQAVVSSFDDILHWVGEGANQAALVIQWNDGLEPVSLVWGYRWDGEATGLDMLLAIAGQTTFIGDPVGAERDPIFGANPALQLVIEHFSFGDAIASISYHQGGTTREQAGWLTTGYWEYYCMGGEFYSEEGENTFAGSSYYPGTQGTPDWISSWSGAGERLLSNGSWDAWSFAVNFESQPIHQPETLPIPEPSACLLLGGAFLWWFTCRKTRQG